MSNTCTNAQQKAINHYTGPCMVIAGPGSGKTFVITKRIQNLIQKHHVDPARILVITFSKAAAVEMKARFHSLSENEYQPVLFGTFHAIYFQIVKRAYQLDYHNIITENEKRTYLKEYLFHAPKEILVDDELVEQLLKEISYVKNEGMKIENYQAKCVDEVYFRKLFIAYREKMQSERKIDFDDMLLLAYQLLRERPYLLREWQQAFSFVLVDEFQDINALQFAVLRMLVAPENNLLVVGDDDQSIYGFRGAKPEIMLHFQDYFPDTKTVLLDYNFRSDAFIVENALKVIECNQMRFQKNIKPTYNRNKESFQVLAFSTKEEELQHLRRTMLEAKEKKKLKEVAILYRLNSQGAEIAEWLMKEDIPFRMKEATRSIYDHAIAKDLNAYFHLARGENQREYFYAVMNKPVRYMKREWLNKPEFSWNDFFYQPEIPLYVKDALQRFSNDIIRLRDMSPFSAIIYIRKAIGYENYLKKRATKKDESYVEDFRVLEEITEKSKEFETFEQWFEHIRIFREEKTKAYQRDEECEAVTLMTMHASKGLEWKEVYIPNCNEGNMPSQKAFLAKEIEEERRLFYVGMTRAKEKLVLSWNRGTKEQPREASRFLMPLKHSQD